jgi:hypothetical protein
MALYRVLQLLEKYDLKALFFVTGHMAERLAYSPEIVNRMEAHEIGFHSSAHSVHPTIFEYCDVQSYEEAYQMTLKREVAHINPLSGDVEGRGGIHAVQELFPAKRISAYRAPGYCCPPPHLEAMLTLGIKYDFSWDLAVDPARYKGQVFYPFPVFFDCDDVLLGENRKVFDLARLLRFILQRRVTVLNFHVDRLVNRISWDSIYHQGNPAELQTVPPKNVEQTVAMLQRMEALLKGVRLLEGSRTIDASSSLSEEEKDLDASRIDIQRVLNTYCHWPSFFGYKPRNARSQIFKFFD